jgi:tetratricopeptide (TPR) repeat protein
MTKFECLRMHGMLGRRAGGLSGAEALRLEDHLASCGDCSREAALLDGLREIANAERRSLPPVAREQVIRRAFAQAERLSPRDSGLRRLWLALAAGSLTLAAATAAFLLVVRNGEQPAVTANEARPHDAPTVVGARVDRVLSGVIEIDGVSSDAGTELAAHGGLHARTAATVSLGHAEVRLAAGTALRWDRGQRKLQLKNGRVLAEVNPSARESFTVETPRFTVLVLGTRFEVTLDAVRVERGRVRVISSSGKELAASLGAGEELVVPASSEREAEAAQAVEPNDPRLTERRRALSPPAARAKAPARTDDGAALIAEARAHLAERRVTDARRALEAALAVSHEPNQRAEALSLRAECALVSGDLGTAIEAYLRVARTYAHHPAGQNALFAAARLEAERGRSAAAITLLERYLSRYPNGRFEKEARMRLRELGAVLDHEP